MTSYNIDEQRQALSAISPSTDGDGQAFPSHVSGSLLGKPTVEILAPEKATWSAKRWLTGMVHGPTPRAAILGLAKKMLFTGPEIEAAAQELGFLIIFRDGYECWTPADPDISTRPVEQDQFFGPYFPRPLPEAGARVCSDVAGNYPEPLATPGEEPGDREPVVIDVEPLPPALPVPATTMPPPPAHAIVENVPHKLKQFKQWGCWQWVWCEQKGKYDKPPINPKTGRPANHLGPDWRRTFDDAVEASKPYSGIGLSLPLDGSSETLTGIDLDDCIDEHGVVYPDTLRIVKKLDSYTEYTPSGRGLRILVWGKKPGPECKNTARDIEIYDRGRYFTVTGRVFTDHDGLVYNQIRDRQEALNDLYEELWPAKVNGPLNGQHVTKELVDASDEELLEKARSAKNGAEFAALYDRGEDIHGNASSNDMALMNRLAFYCGRDADRMERLFSASALGQRRKWTDRPDYRKLTIDAAIRDCTEAYQGNGNGKHEPRSDGQAKAPWKSRARLEDEKREKEEKDFDALLSAYRPKTFGGIAEKLAELKHLWPNWLILGNVTMIWSKPKIGKTRSYIGFMKPLWFGQPFPDGAPNPWGAGIKTLVLPYDRNHQEIHKEMKLAGIPDEAAVCPHDPRDETGASLMSITDPLMLKLIEKILTDDRAIKLIVIDTLTYASDKSLCKPEDMKAILDGIMLLALKHGVSVLCLLHENKEGEALGRRINERARVLCRLERYSDADPKRLRLFVKESNFSERPSIAVIHENDGVKFERDMGPAKPADRRDDCARWLFAFLWEKGVGVDVDYGTLINAAGEAGFAGEFNEQENRWGNRKLLDRAIAGINTKAKSLEEFKDYQIDRREEPRLGRPRPVIYYCLVCTNGAWDTIQCVSHDPTHHE